MVKTLYNDVTSISRDLRVEPQLVARLEFTTDKYIKGFES